MLGDSQDERTGLGSIRRTGGFDVVNPYWHMNIYVLKTKSGFINKTVRLQVSEDRAAQFNEILSQHNITRETKTRMYFTGVNPWFILLFGVPFGLLCLWFLYGVWVNR